MNKKICKNCKYWKIHLIDLGKCSYYNNQITEQTNRCNNFIEKEE